MIRLVDITENNFFAARALAVAPEQRGFLDSAEGILARGYLYRAENARVWAVEADGEAAGLALVKDMDEAPACYDLQQFMIDARFQGRGFGTRALQMILERLRNEGKYDCVEVCVKRQDLAALRLYEKAGFADTGYVDPDAPDCLNLRYAFRNRMQTEELRMNIEYIRATADRIDLLVRTRVEVLRAANRLDDSADLSEVEAQSRDYYLRALRDGTHTAFLAFDGDAFVGAGGVSYFRVMPTCHNPTGWKAYVMNMYVRPAYRRRGIATRMLDLLVGDARARGIGCISLEATDAGRPLYENYGFIPMTHEMELP